MDNNEFKKVSIKNLTCYYFDSIIKFEDFDFDILLDGKSYENVLVYDISYKSLIKWFDKIDGFIRVHDGSR